MAGSVYQRKKDGRWVAALSIRGKGKRVRYASPNTKRAAERALDVLKREAADGVSPSRQTFSSFVPEWLESHRSHIRESTATVYEGILRNHFLPALGGVRMVDLQARDLARLYASLECSPVMVGQVHRVIHVMLRDAERWGMVSRNVADLVSPPAKMRHEPVILSAAEARRVLDVARDTAYEAAYWLGIQGLRSGEALALRWQDVDFVAKTARVRGTLVWRKGGWYVSEPKTATSRRLVGLTQPAVDALRRRESIQRLDRMAAGPAWQEHGLVFTSSDGRPVRSYVLIKSHFRPILKRCKFPKVIQQRVEQMRFHDLRHNCVSLMLAAGIDLATISRVIGHASPKVTAEVYAHMLPGAERAAADALSGQLGHYVIRVDPEPFLR